MAYKDEYEVARLHLDAVFRAKLSSEFEPGFKINYHLAPPAVPTGRDHRGRPRKIQFGSWMNGPFRALQSLKRLRGTRLDMFGLNHERKTERELISWYEGVVGQLCSHLTCDTVDNMAQICNPTRHPRLRPGQARGRQRGSRACGFSGRLPVAMEKPLRVGFSQPLLSPDSRSHSCTF
jgi:hypothetical protein